MKERKKLNKDMLFDRAMTLKSKSVAILNDKSLNKEEKVKKLRLVRNNFARSIMVSILMKDDKVYPLWCKMVNEVKK